MAPINRSHCLRENHDTKSDTPSRKEWAGTLHETPPQNLREKKSTRPFIFRVVIRAEGVTSICRRSAGR
jgi:hypothetical protein